MADDQNGAPNGDGAPGGAGAGSQAGQGSQTPGGSQQSPGGTQNQQPQHSSQDGDGSRPSAREKELEKLIAELRKENAQHRTKLKEFEDAQLSEKEKLEKQLAELQKERDELARERQAARVAEAVTEAARKAGAKYPEAIHRLVTVELDSHGQPTNLDAQVKAVRERYPELFGASGSADGGAGRGKEPRKGWLRESIDRSR